MKEILFSDKLREKYSRASIAVLEMRDIKNRDEGEYLLKVKKETESALIRGYSDIAREDMIKDPVLKAYRDYYRKFKKTYHLLLQLESIAKKGRSFPSVNPLADSCFIAEMSTFILTAGHDADLLSEKIVFDLSGEMDEFTRINGQSIVLKQDDMIMRSGGKNVCSVIYGQDNSTVLSPATENAFYVSYVPEGVPGEAVLRNLDMIESLVNHFSPSAETEIKQVYRLG